MDLLKNYISEVFLSEAQRYKTETGEKFDKFAVVEKYINDPWVFFRYTTINKLGVNPQYIYSNFFGIYSYPIEMIKNEKSIHFKGKHSPKYIHIFSVKPEYRDKMIILNQNCSSNIDAEIKEKTKFKRFAGLLKDIISDEGIPMSPIRQSQEIMKLGYYGIINRGCYDLHYDIPEEAVFFSKKCIEHLETIELFQTTNNKSENVRNEIISAIEQKDVNKIYKIVTKGTNKQKIQFLQSIDDYRYNNDNIWQKFINLLYNDKDSSIRYWVATLTKDKKILSILSKDPDTGVSDTATSRYKRSDYLKQLSLP